MTASRIAAYSSKKVVYIIALLLVMSRPASLDGNRLDDGTDPGQVRLTRDKMEAVGFPRDAQGMADSALPKGLQVQHLHKSYLSPF